MKINNRIAKFSKVSFEQFLRDYCKAIGLEENNKEVIVKAKTAWDNIKLSIRKIGKLVVQLDTILIAQLHSV